MASGGPLLALDDLIHDLNKDQASPNFPWLDRPSATQQDDHLPQDLDLVEEIQETCRDLNAALERPGYAWTSLNQKLCTSLAAAAEIVRISHANFAQLLQKLQALRAIVSRGEGTLKMI
ncbi:uncharacterized protein LOC112344936 [Selaginella moellendorffii]|uniref:uncharacterized protein LOC112344936 n=1 Tax=Selaginella moellendorffii TaxID=88036 RepID=UPI000D1CD4F5|nr:uncharacterized protein LOC112344936 [Selaginella moellendorffii]|eukprot:XP_024526358.1 uncharacterized protein LOC112344936 [Selaginella moellendorffii]